MIRTIAIRFGIPLMLALAAGAFLAVPLAERFLTQWFRADIEMRSRLVMNLLELGLVPLLDKPSPPRLRTYLAKVTSDQRLLAIVVCGRNGVVLHRTDATPREIACPAARPPAPVFDIIKGAEGLLHVATFPLEQLAGNAWGVAIVHDLSFIDRRQSSARDYLIVFAGLSATLILLLCVTMAWFVLRGWARSLVRDIRGKQFLEGDRKYDRFANDIFGNVRQALREIEQAQRMEIDFRENWTADALRHVVKDHLDNAQMIVVSNREPYVHVKDRDRIVVQHPASGMVTALEPVIRACSGVWIAHGSGSADRDVVDIHDRVRVPPRDPSYALRRVWLSAEEEQGYYYGFANEGMWPLCHLAFVRPAFRKEDWAQYVNVNTRFAEAVAIEARSGNPVVFVQDYHFTLVPRLIRERLPGATIALFWHIPWPNPETFGICPWRREVLLGLLQADIVGFHTRFHCQNFLATVDRFVESHIDYEHSTVTIGDHVCRVAAYPISIEWPPQWLEKVAPIPVCRQKIFAEHGLAPTMRLGLGVERWDFTKGIVDRLLALERLLEAEPKWQGKLVFLQIAAPSRGQLPAYQELQKQTHIEAERINARFGDGNYRPVVLITEHQDPEKVYELYRACDFCLVNSLHDGMNLVAKEFVAARDDEDGVLILSTFAGASRELPEALIVNPFDLEETARAISQSLSMPVEERRERMRLMRMTVKERNVFRWAGRILMDAARIRQRLRLQTLTTTPKRDSPWAADARRAR
ncbi:MAG: trehalose-6-phosphate synthase [Burkholderiales bacterium]